MTQPRVVIVGGGVSGLSAACTLQDEARTRQQPVSLLVLEAGGTAGGHARTLQADGFVIETGPNGFLSREPDTLDLVERVGMKDRLVEANPAARRRFILRDGRLCLVPDSPRALVHSPALSWRGKLRLLAEPWAPGPPEREETVHEFAARRIGREAADMLVDAAVSGISAGDSRRLSVSAQFPMMTEMEREHGGLFRAMLARRKDGRGPSRLMSFDRGMGALTFAMAARLGARVQTQAPVRGIERVDGEWRVHLKDGNTVGADHVVLATPARAAAPLVSSFDRSLAAALLEVPYAGVAVLAFGFRADDIPHPLDGYGYLVTRGEGLATLGVLWESSIFPGRAADGMALLRVFLGGARRPDIVSLDEEALVELARVELRRVLGVVREPSHVSVFRWPEAIAQYTLGHAERRARIAARLERHQDLHVCGTSYDGISFNHAVTSGCTLARTLAARIWTATGTGADAAPRGNDEHSHARWDGTAPLPQADAATPSHWEGRA